MVFIEIEKACDKVPRVTFWRTLKARGFLRIYVMSICDVYCQSTTCLLVRDICHFSVKTELHHGSTLNTFIFALI